MSEDTPYDLLVIGGGINGVGIARDAAGRGAKVLLCEKDDLASHTSSASTKLVHGGLRYLEHYEFRLVRESLIERERLLGMAPHIIWPLRFVLPHDKGLRPSWLLRLGLFLYDHIGGRKLLPATKTLDLRAAPHGDVLEERLIKGFEYSDCWVEDARLVVLNAMDAARRGADIRTRTECVSLDRSGQVWLADLKDEHGKTQRISARTVVNAAGPWVDNVLGKAMPEKQHQNLRLVKGSHLIFPKLFDHDQAYIFQNKDDRIVFAIPYEREFTLVGTTDVAFKGDANTIEISDDESAYICDAINEYLKVDVAPDQAIWSYSGVRPLYDDQSRNNSTVTRDYVFELDNPEGAPPILSIFGGKITTYRKLAEHALHKLPMPWLETKQAWTAGAGLPGGEIHVDKFNAFVSDMQSRYDWCAADVMFRLCRAYGTLLFDVIGDATNWAAMGEDFGAGLTEAEVEYLIEHEFAQTADDVLWRRSKLGLHMDDEERKSLESWFAKRGAVRVA
ncbi:glycerol-3-phosphate dehydrogenase [Pontixanthobacter aestiaquae]|uniref:Glycerol-3-phosphate dehydrogenase n=1 Tax=Pontixanthobacter aestiaquae TaxID=1509367 RepID=A0A844Z8X7_9SPHN|nr:glycerol-3-phosphate dehydrogenase [Pontixanthobacter aestiaquae]MDN3644725.1 glycerol-3-phosphate dehydrogenase [Pontixanthobacter aestiaquae]MXO84268.1 glycerol-3-phosphate dehydrogenase [Pontixanthobacter aestiaquae]